MIRPKAKVAEKVLMKKNNKNGDALMDVNWKFKMGLNFKGASGSCFLVWPNKIRV
jgi:hypothetical protein